MLLLPARHGRFCKSVPMNASTAGAGVYIHPQAQVRSHHRRKILTDLLHLRVSDRALERRDTAAWLSLGGSAV